MVFDPEVVDYGSLLDVFWNAHDPCSNTRWRQYRNAVFYIGEAQKAAVLAAKVVLEERLGRALATAIEPAGIFTPAEDYHQKYSLRQRRRFYDAVRRLYPDEADFIASTTAARLNGYLGGFGDPEQLRRDLDRLGLDAAAREELLATTGNLLR